MPSYTCCSVAVCALFVSLLAPAQNVTTERYNIARTGATAQSIDPVTVQQRWSKLGEVAVRGRVYAQPLFVQAVQTTSGMRKLIFIATEENQIYAFDADSLALIWTRNLGVNDHTKAGYTGCDGISVDGIGIEATPVIDPASNRMYISFRTNSSASMDSAQEHMVALDMRSGATVLGPATVTYPGFAAAWVRSRASLLLLNGRVYQAFASRCEDPGKPMYHGAVVAWPVSTLADPTVFHVTPDDLDGGGVWQASSGLASDGEDIYIVSANRRIGSDTHDPDYASLSDSFIRLHPAMGPGIRGPVFQITARDWFTPYRKIWMDDIDMDLGSAGPVVTPDGQHILGGGKQGWIYVLDKNNMGKLDAGHKWGDADVAKLHKDSTVDQFPENASADKVVQKFQAGFQQYIPAVSSYLAPPGAPVAAATQNQNQVDVFNVGRDGAIYVNWQGLAPNAPWSDGRAGHPYAAAITPKLSIPGAYVAAAAQGTKTDNQLDAFVSGTDGAVYVTWSVGLQAWTDGLAGHPTPARITPQHILPPGGCLSTATQGANQLDVFFVGNDGAVYVTWSGGLAHWSDGTPGNAAPARITPTNFALPGACVATAMQSATQLDALVMNKNDGAAYVTWVNGLGHWTDGTAGNPAPFRITPKAFADSRASLAASAGIQRDNQLDVFLPGLDGTVYVTWVVGGGAWTDGDSGRPRPAPVTPAHATGPLTPLSAAKQVAGQLDVFYTAPDGTVMVTWVVGVGHWSDGTPGNPSPAPATTPRRTVANAHTVASTARAGELDVFLLGDDGEPWVTKVVRAGIWTNGSNPAVGGPQGLSRAMWMLDDWFEWPHIHGSPVIATFHDGSQRIYVWPEKDHLKSYAWTGSSVDVNSKILGVDAKGTLLLDPDGMPGGMLGVAVNPASPRSGVIFASLTQNGETDGPGLLRALDAVTLKEVWNNRGEIYQFSKFVPPTIANNKVYLPTCSNKVLVYGPH